jgi:hypothetical protein
MFCIKLCKFILIFIEHFITKIKSVLEVTFMLCFKAICVQFYVQFPTTDDLHSEVFITLKAFI